MLEKLKKGTRDKKDRIIARQRARIREKAISNAKARIALHGKKADDYDKEQLEIIVQKEEEKIIRGLKNSALYGVLVVLGLGYF
jgi:hypothetical protein